MLRYRSFSGGVDGVFDPVSNALILFGGMSDLVGAVPTNELWILRLEDTTGTWQAIQAKGTPPPPRYYHTTTYDPVNHRIIVYGGKLSRESSKYADDVWALSLGFCP
jgi:hypothetical protein